MGARECFCYAIPLPPFPCHFVFFRNIDDSLLIWTN